MRKKRKVLMLVENLSVPADPRVWKEACTLQNAGLQVSIISPKGQTHDQESYICLEGITIYRYKLASNAHGKSSYMQEYATAMLMTFGLSLVVWFQRGFDVIHAANPPDTFFVIGLFYRLLGKKYIFDQHDLAPEMFQVKFQARGRLFYKLLQWLERCSYQTAQLVITTNESQKRHAIERGKCAMQKIFIVRNGPEITRYRQSMSELKRRNRHLLVYIGVMGIQDGVEYALQALNELVHRRERRDITLILLGDGDQLNTLRALASQLELDEYVHFTGWVTGEKMLRYLAAADIGLSPDPGNSLNDRSTMIKTMEYMAMGKPVVAFDLYETRYSAQEAALYATPNCVEEFADHIETLLADEDLRLAMGKYGRKRIEEELCWERTRYNLLQAYEILFAQNIFLTEQRLT